MSDRTNRRDAETQRKSAEAVAYDFMIAAEKDESAAWRQVGEARKSFNAKRKHKIAMRDRWLKLIEGNSHFVIESGTASLQVPIPVSRVQIGSPKLKSL